MVAAIFFHKTIEESFQSLSDFLKTEDQNDFIEISKTFQSLRRDLDQIYKLYKTQSSIIDDAGKKQNIEVLQPVGATNHVSLTELLQEKLDQSVKKICEKIEELLKNATEENKERLKDLKLHHQELLETQQQEINQIQAACEDALKKISPLKPSNNAEEFTTHVATYARSRRHLTNILKLECPTYQGKIVKDAFQSAEEVKKEMAKTFFKKAQEHGYDLEKSSVTIGGQEFKLANVYESKASQNEMIQGSKANATKLLQSSHVNQVSFFFDTPERRQAFKEFLEQAKNAALTMEGGEQGPAVEVTSESVSSFVGKNLT